MAFVYIPELDSVSPHISLDTGSFERSLLSKRQFRIRYPTKFRNFIAKLTLFCSTCV
ncbi:protein of unknown function [Legionella fallonii LLAP-10]|uniref:Uncharacterized protein n=1 Tax=Legionella fallonii LLAP-10 TaxID=1212491 RepID=A0A098G2S5_9GAMM|nr:protein of unknown function [Legionella fallonii LLAP-10]